MKIAKKLLGIALAACMALTLLPATAMAVDPSPDYVLINGVKWATHNVADPGHFAANPEDTGLFYQWDSKAGWPETGAIGSITDTNGNGTWDDTWDGSSFLPADSDTWADTNDPSPDGYRVPTYAEMQTLLDETYVTRTWLQENGVYGYKFTDKNTGKSIFMPASGYRSHNDGTLHDANSASHYYSYYWSSTVSNGYSADTLHIGIDNDSGYAAMAILPRANGLTLRPVVASDFAATTDSSTANGTETLGLVGTSAASSDVGIATAAISNGHIAITSVSAGAATITVTDNASHSATIAVTVNADGSVTLGTITKYMDTTWYTGHETDTSFTIDTGAELAGLASLVNDGTDTFAGDTVTLGANIDLASRAWTPIGTAGHPFDGTFNGGTYSITGLAIGASDSYNATFVHAGLFGCTGAASEIQDVSLVDVAIYAGATSSRATPAMVGGLVGNNGGTVTDCSVAGIVATTGTLNTGEAAYVGGIAGGSTGAFSGCTSAATVTGGDYVGAAGGIVGYTTAGITDCSTSGTVSVGQKHWDAPMAGGIVGYLYNRTDITVKISGCHATGAVSGGYYTQLGGIAGSSEREIINSYATGDVSGGNTSILGGLVGVGVCQITNSYATGSVTGGEGSGAGGLAGSSSFPISKCWASGNVSVAGIGSGLGGFDGNAAGGLVGTSYSSEISYCCATGNASGTVYGGGLIGNNKCSSSPKLTLNGCYAAGKATGEPYCYGGLVSKGAGATMTNCYWNSTLNTAAYGDGVIIGTPTGKSTDAMKTEAFAQLLNDGSGVNCTWIYASGANGGYPMISGVGNAVLSDLTVNSGTLTPAFSSGTTNYSVSVDNSVTDIAVTPTTGDAGASITVNGNAVTSGNASGTIALAAGATTDIAVVITDGMPITYTLHVARAAAPGDPALTGTAELSLNRATGAVTASVTGGNAASLIYTWTGGATGIGVTATPTPGTAATCTVTASGYTGSLTASATVYKAVLSVSGNVGSDSVGDISATRYGQAGDTVAIPYTLSKTAGSQFDGLQLNTTSLNELRNWLLADGTTTSGSTGYTITAADAAGGEISIRITFAHRYNLTMEGGGTGSALAGITAAPMSSVYDAGSWVNINAGTKSGYTFSGWTTSNGGTFGSAASAVTTFTTPLADTVITANWTQNSTDTPNGGGGGGGITTTTPTTTVSGSTATTTVTPTVSGGVATGSVTADQMSDAVKKAQAAAGTNGTPNVTIQVRGASGASSVGTTIPHASMQALVSGGVGALTISGPTGSVSFDAAALKTSSSTSGDVTITVTKTNSSTLSAAAQALIGDHPVFNFSVTSGGNVISQFGGDVTVSVPYTPASGEDTNAIVIYYIAADGTPTLVPDARYDAATGTVIFTTTHFSTYAVGYNKVSFTDVGATAWYADAVTFLSARGVTSGTTATTFSPDATLTRGQFIMMLLRAYGVSAETNPTDNFTDAGSTYYTGYLAAAKKLGVTSGVGDNKFAPDNAITRQEMFTLLYNALKVLDKLPSGATSKTISSFTDSGSIASWATDAMTALVKAGTVTGSNGALKPNGTTTRAEMAQVLYNLLGK